MSSSSVCPFHHAFPVHDLAAARDFYSRVLGLQEGRSTSSWADFNLFGHQISLHAVGREYRAVEHFNPVDRDDVPLPHFGVVLTVQHFKALAERLKNDVEFVISPKLRFEGTPGEQYTMFFRDPSGNNLEFKAMTKPDNLFSKSE